MQLKRVGPQTVKLTMLLIKFMKLELYNFCDMNIKHSLLIINLHDQQADTFVKFSNLANNWHFCTPFIINISISPPLDPKSFYIQRIFFNHSKRV